MGTSVEGEMCRTNLDVCWHNSRGPGEPASILFWRGLSEPGRWGMVKGWAWESKEEIKRAGRDGLDYLDGPSDLHLV